MTALTTTLYVERDGREVAVRIEGYYRKAEPDTDTDEAVVLETASIPLLGDEWAAATEALWERVDCLRGQDEAARELNEQLRREDGR